MIMSEVCLAVFSSRPFSKAFWDLRSGYGIVGALESIVKEVSERVWERQRRTNWDRERRSGGVECSILRILASHPPN